MLMLMLMLCKLLLMLLDHVDVVEALPNAFAITQPNLGNAPLMTTLATYGDVDLIVANSSDSIEGLGPNVHFLLEMSRLVILLNVLTFLCMLIMMSLAFVLYLLPILVEIHVDI